MMRDRMTVLAHNISATVSRSKLAKTNSWLPERKYLRENEVILEQNIKLNVEKRIQLTPPILVPPISD
jgi:hypothetical protein